MPIVLESAQTAKIVELDNQKGYGFLQVGKGRLLLHHRDFAEHHKGYSPALFSGHNSRLSSCWRNWLVESAEEIRAIAPNPE